MCGAMFCTVRKLERAASMLPLRSSRTPKLAYDSAWFESTEIEILNAWYKRWHYRNDYRGVADDNDHLERQVEGD